MGRKKDIGSFPLLGGGLLQENGHETLLNQYKLKDSSKETQNEKAEKTGFLKIWVVTGRLKLKRRAKGKAPLPLISTVKVVFFLQ